MIYGRSVMASFPIRLVTNLPLLFAMYANRNANCAVREREGREEKDRSGPLSLDPPRFRAIDRLSGRRKRSSSLPSLFFLGILTLTGQTLFE